MLVTLTPMFTKRNLPLAPFPSADRSVAGRKKPKTEESADVRYAKPTNMKWNDPWKSFQYAGTLDAATYMMPQFDATAGISSSTAERTVQQPDFGRELEESLLWGNPFTKTMLPLAGLNYVKDLAAQAVIEKLPDTPIYGSAPQEVRNFVNSDTTKRTLNAFYDTFEQSGKATGYFIKSLIPQLPEIRGKQGIPTLFKTVTKKTIGGAPEVILKYIGSRVASAANTSGTVGAGAIQGLANMIGHPIAGLVANGIISTLTGNDSGNVEYSGALKLLPALVGEGDPVSIKDIASDTWSQWVSEKSSDRAAVAILQAL